MSLSRATARTLCAANAQTGLVSTDPRLDVQIDQAMARLVRHYNAFTRQEEYFHSPITFTAASDPLQIDAPDALKLMVLALWREENGRIDEAGALENRAYGLLDQDTTQAWEQTNRDAYLTNAASTAYTRSWYVARLGLDTVGGLSTSPAKLKRIVTRSADWIYQKIYEYQLIERNRVHGAAPTLATQPAQNADSTAFAPVIDYETMRLVAQAITLQGYHPEDPNQQQIASAFLTQAAQLITRRLDAELEALRHGTYTTALGALTSNTFGYFKAQLALELPMGLKLSDSEMGRLVNSAERRLIECGKWKNAIADFEVTIGTNGETDMPTEVEVVLGATICDQPTLVKGRWYEVVEGGPGRVREDRKAVTGLLVDRGEFIVSNVPVRRYYVAACQPDNTLMVRAKRRFATKSVDADVMQIKNFGAVKAAAQCLIHEGFAGSEIAGVPVRDPALAGFYWSIAKKILSDELTEFVGEASQGSMPVQTIGFGAGEIPNIL